MILVKRGERLFCQQQRASYSNECDFGETTGIAEIFRSLKRMHCVPIIDDVFIRGFKNEA